MGQYHLTVNLDKREFINPHELGDGLKLVEQCGWSPGGTNDALHLLLAVSNGRGGGDFEESEWVGRWGGDRIAVVGDYADDKDLAPEHKAGSIYGLCNGYDDVVGEPYRNITALLRPVLEDAYEILYYGDGFCNRKSMHDLVSDWKYSHAVGNLRVARIGAKDYALKDVRESLRRIVVGREVPVPVPLSALEIKPFSPPSGRG